MQQKILGFDSLASSLFPFASVRFPCVLSCRLFHGIHYARTRPTLVLHLSTPSGPSIRLHLSQFVRICRVALSRVGGLTSVAALTGPRSPGKSPRQNGHFSGVEWRKWHWQWQWRVSEASCQRERLAEKCLLISV